MSPTPRLLGAVVLPLVLAVPVALTVPGPPSGALSTVPGTQPTIVQGSTDLGPAPDQTMTATISLRLGDPGGLAAFLAGVTDPASPEYHQFLTPEQFAARYGPSPSAVSAVETWATGSGLTVSSVSPNRTLVTLSGDTGAFSRAFVTAFHDYRAPSGQTYVTPVVPATIPPSLAGDVLAVNGLSSLDAVHLDPLASPSVSFPSTFDPQQFWSYYDAPAAQTGAGQTIAVLAEGDVTQPQADLTTFEHQYGLPTVPWTTVPTGASSSDTSGDVEWDLDTQYSTGLADDVSSLLVYDGPSLSNSDILTEMNQWVTDDKAPQADFSAGECEALADVSGFLASNDQVLAQAVAQGQTLFTASGDTGSFCPVLVGVNGVPAGAPGVNYPASSPFAVGAGGTTILGSPGPAGEVGWYAGGGGLSAVEPEPAFQAGAGGSNTGVGRAVPDVAFDADPNSGYDVVVSGQTTVVGGTSGASPSWLGIWARAQAAHGGTLGFAAPVVYRVPASSFRDIVVGANGAYPCTPGYDMVTGRGTPDIAAFVASA